jgi:two-component system NarL family sensor kinase
LKLRLQLLSRRLQPEQVDAVKDLDQLREQVNDAAVRLNRLAKRLRPPTLDELGFVATLRQLVGEYRQQSGLKIAMEVSNELLLSEDAETALYRIVQEGLNNTVKHSGAQQVTIRLFDKEGSIAMDLEDDGQGFDVDAATAGLGLIGIYERVIMLGGAVHVQSQQGKGTLIQIRNLPPKSGA